MLIQFLGKCFSFKLVFVGVGKIKAPTFHLKTEKNAFIPKFPYDANSNKTVKTSATYPDSIIGCWHCSVVKSYKSYCQLSPKLRDDSQKRDLEMKFGGGSSAPSDYLFILAEYFCYFNHHFPTLSTNIYNTDVTTLSDNSAFEIYCTNSPPHHHHIRLGVNDSQIIRTQHSGPFLWKHLRNSIIASQINPSVSFYISIYKKVALDDATCGHKWCPPTVGLKPELKTSRF